MLFIYRSVCIVSCIPMRAFRWAARNGGGRYPKLLPVHIRSETPTLLSSRRLSWFIFTLRATPTERTENDEERETDKKKIYIE